MELVGIRYFEKELNFSFSHYVKMFIKQHLYELANPFNLTKPVRVVGVIMQERWVCLTFLVFSTAEEKSRFFGAMFPSKIHLLCIYLEHGGM